MTKEQEIRANLYIESPEYDDLWKEWKNNSIKAHDIATALDLDYCLESDFQNEKEYLEECDCKMIIIKNYNGVVIYKKLEKVGK